MAEYPPWELDLYLADFKRVEFSKYMDGQHTAPHVVACAATGEVRYVLSLIQHLVDCMSAREDFFKRMGFEKIAKFRQAYPDVVLPRILLIVDEFQQLFLEASTKESEQIHRMLTAIVKKGRATGVHILFASQEMSQTLSRSDLANFRMRVALNCDPTVSLDVLGNRKAAECPVGYVYVNCSDYSESTNMQFQVPYIKTEVSSEEFEKGVRPYFDKFLVMMSQAAHNIKYAKNTKFYQEDYQEPLEDLVSILEHIQGYRRDIRNQYYDVLTLGRYVTFSPLKYDIQTLFIERGRNRNILAISPNVEDIAYVQRLLSLNFKLAPDDGKIGAYQHMIFSFMPSVENLFPLAQELKNPTKDQAVQVWHNPEDFSLLEQHFFRMRFLLAQFQESENPMEFALLNYRRNVDRATRRHPEQKEAQNACIPQIMERFQNITFENAEEICAGVIQEESGSVLGKIAQNIIEYCRYKQNPTLVFPPTVVWINGVDVIERLPDWFLWMMKNGMDYNLLFVCMSCTEFDAMTQLNKYCDYLFLGGSNRRIYDRLNVNYTSRDLDSIVLDMVIKGSGEERSFKKYRCSFGHRENARVPFELLLD